MRTEDNTLGDPNRHASSPNEVAVKRARMGKAIRHTKMAAMIETVRSKKNSSFIPLPQTHIS
jgi:hypothetical protein